MKFSPGERVYWVDNPSRKGTTLSKPRAASSGVKWSVRFDDGTVEQIFEDQLEHIIDAGTTDPISQVEDGNFGKVEDLRRNLTYVYLSGRLANFVYSYGVTDIDFFPYQYKPLLNILDSPVPGLLIADEVGLGKTIEAGIIWTELRARYDLRRLLVVCPPILRKKWQDELYNKFGIDATIVNAEELLGLLKHPGKISDDGKALIISYTAARPTEKKRQRGGSPRCQLARYLENNAHGDTLFDMVIFDEAHYMRNSDTQTWELGNLLKDVSEYKLLLSATPINLRNKDLFNILRLVDPEHFLQESDFNSMLTANSYLVKAREIALDKQKSVRDFRLKLNEALANPILRKNLQLKTLASKDIFERDYAKDEFRVKLASNIERINLLSYIVSRTRKRDVLKNRIFRNVIRVPVTMTDTERSLYSIVTRAIIAYAIKNKINKGFLLAMPQRRVSSCPAAFFSAMPEDGFYQRQDDPETCPDAYDFLEYEASGSASVKLGDALCSSIPSSFSFVDLYNNDSKFAQLKKIVFEFLDQFPNEKIVIFTSFVKTAKYLHDKLRKEGYKSLLITGGTERDDRQNILQSFRDDREFRFLISTEVTAEGVDLQFCSTMINYDLPWNPTRIEQRIGRIDRLGQKAKKIHIYNFYYCDTIDERIVKRLLERLETFQEALGECEEMIGKEITNLEREIFCRDLSPQEINAAIDQTCIAIETELKNREKLEENAAHLIAYGQTIFDQIRTTEMLSRRVTETDLCIYVHDYLNRYWDDFKFEQRGTDQFRFVIKLPPRLAGILGEYIKEKRFTGKTKLHSGSERQCLFVNKVTHIDEGRNVECISQFHPLIRFITHDIKLRCEDFQKVVSISLPKSNAPAGINPGVYAFYVKLWCFSGIKDEEILDSAISPLGSNKIICGDDAHAIINAVRVNGCDWQFTHGKYVSKAFIDKLDDCDRKISERFHELRLQKQNENTDRITMQIDAIDRYLNERRESYEKVLYKHREAGRASLIKALEGKIAKLQARMETQKEMLRGKEKILPSETTVCMGVINIT